MSIVVGRRLVAHNDADDLLFICRYVFPANKPNKEFIARPKIEHNNVNRQRAHKNTEKLIEIACVRRDDVFFIFFFSLSFDCECPRLCYALKYSFQTISVCANTIAAIIIIIIIIQFVVCDRCSVLTSDKRTHNTYLVFTTVPLDKSRNHHRTKHAPTTNSSPNANENELIDSGRT